MKRKPSKFGFFGARSVALLFLSVWAVSRGVSYLPRFEPRDVPEGIKLLITGTPLPVSVTTYAVLWLIAGACTFVGAFLRHNYWAFLIVLGMGTMASVAFSLSYLYSLGVHYLGNGLMPINRDWVTAGGYVGPTGALYASLVGRRRTRKAPKKNDLA